MITLVVARSHYLVHWVKPRFPKAKRDMWRARGRNALFALLIGYALWNVDLEFCAELRRLRERIGLPWAWLLELHGWWHVLTAVSASEFMDIVRELNQESVSEKED